MFTFLIKCCIMKKYLGETHMNILVKSLREREERLS